MNWVLNVFFIGIIFIKYYITQTKIFKVKIEKERLQKSKQDTCSGTEGVPFNFLNHRLKYYLMFPTSQQPSIGISHTHQKAIGVEVSLWNLSSFWWASLKIQSPRLVPKGYAQKHGIDNLIVSNWKDRKVRCTNFIRVYKAWNKPLEHGTVVLTCKFKRMGMLEGKCTTASC